VTRILVADDDIYNRRLLETVLREYGFEVEAAADGLEALKLARKNPPDLFVSDILMPVMDGFALCKHCKTDSRLRHIPFVFYTANYTDQKDERFALSLGVERFIVKPQYPGKLVAMLKEVLEERSAGTAAGAPPLGEEMEFFRQYNEVLFRKLENKMLELEEANQALAREVEERKAVDERLVASLEEKELLLRELSHRTKNSMNVIVSLIDLQTASIADEKVVQLFEETKYRIMTMALVHEKLHRSRRLSSVNIRRYVADLADALIRGYHLSSGNIEMTMDIDDIDLSIDSVTPLGLVINELISNSMKYAFPGDRAGRISIACSTAEDGWIELRYGDNGPGFPAGVDAGRAASLGLRLVYSLIEHQLKGIVKVDTTAGGVAYVMRFREPRRKHQGLGS